MNKDEIFVDAMGVDEITESLSDVVLRGATSRGEHWAYDPAGGAGLFFSDSRGCQLDEAEALFRNLCMYDFTNPEYMIGLATVFKLRKDYARAVDLYTLAHELAKRDLEPVLQSGQCYLLMGRALLARRCFSMVAQRGTDERLKQQALFYLRGLDEAGVVEPEPQHER